MEGGFDAVWQKKNMVLPEDEVANQVLLQEADTILKVADDKNLILRIMGSIAFRIHCPKYVNHLDRMERKLTDVDFASYSKQRDKIEKLLAEFGYVTQSYVSVAAATLGRSIYWNAKNREMKVDIFWDRLQMNHTINFEGRLELDKPTLPLSELLQEKLQIVKLNMKDVKDTMVLLLEHDLSDNAKDREVIDLKPILKQASSDWGYCYTFSTNLKKIQDILKESETLSLQEKAIVESKLSEIINSLEAVPKTLAWKLRARVGPKTRWYQEVE